MTCQFVASDARPDLQPSPQCLDDTDRSPLLPEAQHGIDHQQRAHHGDVRVLPQHRRQHHDQLGHPSGELRELLREVTQQMRLAFEDFVGPASKDSRGGLGLRESGLEVGAETGTYFLKGSPSQIGRLSHVSPLHDAGGTTTTGTGAWRATPSAVLPNTRRVTPD